MHVVKSTLPVFLSFVTSSQLDSSSSIVGVVVSAIATTGWEMSKSALNCQSLVLAQCMCLLKL